MPARAQTEARDDRPQEDHFVVLRGATWDDYQRVLAIRGDRSAPRIAYSKGVLEIMSPSRHHEVRKSLVGRLVEVWCEEHGIEFSPYGSWTLQEQAIERGVEPDECYVLGDVPEPERPDLAIEVVWTSGGIAKLDIYRDLGVREVWFWRRGRIRIYVLRDGDYQEGERSEVLPDLDVAELAGFVERTPASRAMREYRAAPRARRG